MITKEQADAHHARSIRAALGLVERQRYSDALSLLEANLGPSSATPTFPSELSRLLRATGRRCANGAHQTRRLGEYLYEAAINSAEPMEAIDVHILVKWGNKNLALRACRLININQQSYRKTSLAYVYHTLGNLRDTATRVHLSVNDGKATHSKMQGRHAISVEELVIALYQWLYGANSENELIAYINLSIEVKGADRNSPNSRTKYDKQGGIDEAQELSRYCRQSAIAWTAFAKDVAEGTSENTRTAGSALKNDNRPQELLESADNRQIARQMLEEIFTIDSLTTLKETHEMLLSGKLKEAATTAFRMKDEDCIVSRVLGLTIETQATGLLGTGQPKIYQLDTSLERVKPVAGIASVLTMSLHVALIVRLVTAGLLERAFAELSILSYASSLSISRMEPAITYLSGVLELSRPDHASMGSFTPMRETVFHDIVGNNLYTNLSIILRELDKEGFESIYGSGLAKDATALKKLQQLKLEGRYAEYVEYAGSVTDELLAEDYQDYEFVFDIRVNQAEVLENLGRTRHAERVASYVLDNGERMRLSVRIQTKARVVLGRSLLAQGEVPRARNLLYDARSFHEMSTAELYVRSLVNERSGNLIEANRDLTEITRRSLSSEEYSLLKLEKGQIERKRRLVAMAMDADQRSFGKVGL